MEITNIQPSLIIWSLINIAAFALIIWLIVKFVKRKNIKSNN